MDGKIQVIKKRIELDIQLHRLSIAQGRKR